MRLWNYKGEQKNISAALQLAVPQRAVISVTGAGGKTSLVTAWARELAGAGRHTVITTTTHMAHPDRISAGERDPYSGITVIYADISRSEADPALQDRIDDAAAAGGAVMVVSPDPANPAKVTQPPEWVMDHLYQAADAVLIEADGSRRMPCKWPAPWEPAVPENTDITVCVAGLSALGKPLGDVMYRNDLLPERLRRETVDETLFSAILASIDGGRKGSRGEFRVFMNQADSADLQNTAAHLQLILGVHGIQSAWGTLL